MPETTLPGALGAATAAAEEFSLEAPGQTQGQFWLLVTLALGLAVLGTVLYFRSDYAGLDEVDERQPDHLSALRKSKRNQSPASLRLSAETAFATYRDTLLALFDELRGESTDENLEHKTFADAIQSYHRQIRNALAPVTGLPRQVLWLGELGILLGVTGIIATSVNALANALTSEGGYPSAGRTIHVVIDALGGGAGLVADVATAYPYAGAVWNVLFTLGILSVEWLYNYGFVLAPLLILGAAAIYVLERRVIDVDLSEVDTRVSGSPTWTLVSIVGVLLTAWLVGLAFGLVGDLLGGLGATGLLGTILGTLQTLCYALGLLASVAVLGYTAYHSRGRIAYRIRRAASTDYSREPDRWLLTYIGIRNVSLSLAAVTAWLVPVYLGVILVDGKLWVLIRALANARLEVQVFLATVGLLAVGWALYHARVAWPDLKAAIAETSSRTWVRTRLFARGVPFLGIGVAYIIAYNLFQSILLGLAVAFLIGVGARLAYAAILKARDNATLFEAEETDRNVILFQAYELEDDDGNTHPAIRLNGDHLVAGETRAQVVDAAIQAAEELAAGEDVSPSLESWYADDLLERGIVDIDRTAGRVDEKIRKEVAHAFRENDRHLQESELEEILADYPEERWRDRLEHWKHKQGVFTQRGDHIRMRRDPWAEFTE